MVNQSQLELALGNILSRKIEDMPDPRMNDIDKQVYFLPLLARMRENAKRFRQEGDAELAANVLKIAVEDGLYIQTKPRAEGHNERDWSDKLLYAPNKQAYEHLEYLCHFCEENPERLIKEYRRSKHYIYQQFADYFKRNKYLRYIYV